MWYTEKKESGRKQAARNRRWDVTRQVRGSRTCRLHSRQLLESGDIMQTYIIRIYRCRKDRPGSIIGTAEHVGNIYVPSDSGYGSQGYIYALSHNGGLEWKSLCNQT